MLQGAGHGPGSHVAMSPTPTGEKVVGPAPWAQWDIGASTGKTQGEKNIVLHADAFGDSHMFLFITIEMQRCQLVFFENLS